MLNNTMEGSTFTDFYEILEISPNANSETIDRIFRYLAHRYHPDNQDTGNRLRFDEILDAYICPKIRADADSMMFSTKPERVCAGNWPRKPVMVRASNGMAIFRTSCGRFFPSGAVKTLTIPASAMSILNVCQAVRGST